MPPPRYRRAATIICCRRCPGRAAAAPPPLRDPGNFSGAQNHLHKQQTGLFSLSEGKVTSVRHQHHLPKTPRCVSRVAPSWFPAQSFLGALLFNISTLGARAGREENTKPVLLNRRVHVCLKCKGTAWIGELSVDGGALLGWGSSAWMGGALLGWVLWPLWGLLRLFSRIQCSEFPYKSSLSISSHIQRPA